MRADDNGEVFVRADARMYDHKRELKEGEELR